MKVKKIEVDSIPPHCNSCKFFKEGYSDNFWNQIKSVFGFGFSRFKYSCLLTDESVEFDLVPQKSISDKCPLVLRADTKLEKINACIEWLKDINSERKGFSEIKEQTLGFLREYYNEISKRK